MATRNRLIRRIVVTETRVVGEDEARVDWSITWQRAEAAEEIRDEEIRDSRETNEINKQINFNFNFNANVRRTRMRSWVGARRVRRKSTPGPERGGTSSRR